MKAARVIIAVNSKFTGKGSKVQDPDDEDRFGMVIRFANDAEFWVDWDDSPVFEIVTPWIEIELCKFKD